MGKTIKRFALEEAKVAGPAVLVKSASDAGEVFIALKMPNGIYLCTFTQQTVIEAQPGAGHREVPKAFPSGLPQVRLNGYAAPAGQSPRCEVINGFAITKGVPAKVWNLWYEQNRKDSTLIERGLIFASPKYEDVKAYCREHAKLQNGLEPVNPAGDERMPGKTKNIIGFNHTSIETLNANT